jgi:hypothetical protein
MEFDKNLDTAKSYQGFTCYRDLGPTRTLEGAYQVYRHQKGIKTVPGFFRGWCQKGQWVNRAHAFDLESDRIRQSDLSSEARKTHEQRIEQIRSTAESLAITQLETSLTVALLVQDAVERLKARWESGEGEDVQNANLLLILASIKSKDSATVENSLKLADEALGLGDLLDRLKS